MVLFVFREDYYVAAREPRRPMDGDEPRAFDDHAKWAMEMERVFGLAELIVAKQRHGATGKVKLKFDAKITRSEEHTSELQSLMRISYAVFCLTKKKIRIYITTK